MPGVLKLEGGSLLSWDTALRMCCATRVALLGAVAALQDEDLQGW